MGIVTELAKFYELWNSWSDRKLTEPEKELLALARDNDHPIGGAVYLRSTDQTGEFVVVGQRSFVDDTDHSIRVTYLDAVDKLIRRGLLRHEGGQLFVLSGEGWEFARKLK